MGILVYSLLWAMQEYMSSTVVVVLFAAAAAGPSIA